MKFLTLYFVLLKATATTFAGLASLPVVRDELVVQRHVLTDHQLNAAIVITRSTPGPVGLYVVSVGYFADGIVGAIAGWLAMATPALGIIFLLRFIGPRAEHPRIRGMLRAVVLASAGLLVASAVPLARDGVAGPITFVIAFAGLVALLSKKVDTLWVIGAGAAISLVSALLGVRETSGL
ncbi:chromate transporter [Pendulispora albinea]|uniref:Chromate transporter n=1 Tax=Pendulispora albinea TaxID=2741071 RepID=A0ABZ2MBB5_9BACT